MEPGNNRITVACSRCDALLEFEVPMDSVQIRCGRCGESINPEYSDWSASAGCALTSIILLVIATQFSFLGFSIRGKSQVISLWESSAELWRTGEPLLSFFVFIFTTLLPLILAALILMLHASIRYKWSYNLTFVLGRGFSELAHWNMVEVYMIGVLVSLTKISAMANIELGFAFWAFLGVVITLILALAKVDHRTVWSAINKMAPCS